MIKFNFHSKNIIIILKSFVLGGAEKQALYLANELQNNRNCKVYIYAYFKPHDSESFLKTCEKYKLKNLYTVQNPLSASGRFKYLKRRIKIMFLGLKLRKHKPDIIIPYLNPPSIIVAFCYKIAGAKVTFWHHRGPDYYRYDRLEKVAVKKIPFFVANSTEGKEELIQVLNTPRNKTYFLSNYLTISEINNKKNIEILNNIKEKVIIGMLAHFRIQKRQDLLVEAFGKVLNKYQNIHLILAGNIYESKDELSKYKKVNKLIKTHKLENNISIIHYKSAEEILPYLDIGVLLSKKEGMPNVIMEYMAYSLPIVCTKHVGCVSLLGDKYPFYIENNNDVDLIASKLETLIKKASLKRRIGTENKNRLQKDFLIDTYLDKLATLINNHS